MSDLIRREDAIAAATSCPDSHWGPWIAERLRALPAVQPDARLREALTDAWDAHNKHGDQMSGWWVHDDALKGESQ